MLYDFYYQENNIVTLRMRNSSISNFYLNNVDIKLFLRNPSINMSWILICHHTYIHITHALSPKG
jgi:hypothetical protein